mgnify:CR=1 FL=1
MPGPPQNRSELKKKILIHDIAKHLDVSIATVSLVLNGKAKEKRISDALAERVLKYVAEVGYKPNQLAKSLRTGKTHVIGLMVEDIANAFFAKIAALIEKKALARGYRIIYCSTNNDVAQTRDLLAMFQERHVDGYALAVPPGVEAEVRALKPDFARLAALDYVGIIATAPGTNGVDFVSRFFAPRVGVPEDPVTGSAHSTLIPFWAEKLGKTELHARQISPRGGDLWCQLRGERVDISGYAVTYSVGEIRV